MKGFAPSEETCPHLYCPHCFLPVPGSAVVDAPLPASVSLPVPLPLSLSGPAVAVFVSVSVPLSLPFLVLLSLPFLLPLAVAPLSFPFSLLFPLLPIPLELQPLLLPLVLLLFQFLQSKTQTGLANGTFGQAVHFATVHRSSGFQILRFQIVTCPKLVRARPASEAGFPKTQTGENLEESKRLSLTERQLQR